MEKKEETRENNKKVIATILAVIAIIVVTVTATYAWWQWTTSAGQETTIGIQISDFSGSIIDVPIDTDVPGYNPSDPTTGGILGPLGSITGATLYPVSAKTSTGAIKKYFSLAKNSGLAAVTMNGAITLKLNTFPAVFASELLKWEIVKGGTTVASGDFDGKAAGETFILYDGFEITETTDNYIFYFWMDGTQGENPTTTQNQAFSMEMTVTATSEGD